MADIREILISDYLADLGVDALWLSPIFTSPMRDFGYDVADYCDVDPRFGDLAASDALLAAADLGAVSRRQVGCRVWSIPTLPMRGIGKAHEPSGSKNAGSLPGGIS
jgi:hypothetical protein